MTTEISPLADSVEMTKIFLPNHICHKNAARLLLGVLVPPMDFISKRYIQFNAQCPREGWQRKSFGNAYCQRLERTARFLTLAQECRVGLCVGFLCLLKFKQNQNDIYNLMHNALARDGSGNPLAMLIAKDWSVQPGSAAQRNATQVP